MLVALLAAAHAADTVRTEVIVIPAEPAQVQALLSDLATWPGLWDIGGKRNASRRHVRGAPGSLEQELFWSAAPRIRAHLWLTELSDTQLQYEVTWNIGLTVPGRQRPADHEGTIELDPHDDGTLVSWTVRADGRDNSLKRRLPHRLEAMAALVAEPPELPPRAPVERADVVMLWRGFHHRWTYNHRINRSGDWWTFPLCEGAACTSTHVHSAASGSGADRATFEGWATLLGGPGLTGWYGAIELWLDGRETRDLSDRHCITVPEAVPDDAPVLLGGYDLDAVEAADSLWSLSVAVEREPGQVCARADIRMACRTPECGTERMTTYKLDVPFVIADGPGLSHARTSVEQEHGWQANDLRDEPDPAAHPLSTDLPVDPDAVAAVGLSGFSVRLDGPHHSRGLDVAVRSGEARGGALPVELDLFYVQWGPVEIAPLTVAQFAHPGEAKLSADLVTLQLPDGCADQANTSGRLFWPGKQADASVPAAEHRADAPFDLPCLVPEATPDPVQPPEEDPG